MTVNDLQSLFDLLQSFAALPGVIALVPVIVAIAKHFGLPDGQSGGVSLVLNLVAAVGLYAFVQFGGQAGQADSVLGEIAKIGAALLALLLQIGGSKLVYLLGKWANVPVLSKSFTPKA